MVNLRMYTWLKATRGEAAHRSGRPTVLARPPCMVLTCGCRRSNTSSISLIFHGVLEYERETSARNVSWCFLCIITSRADFILKGFQLLSHYRHYKAVTAGDEKRANSGQVAPGPHNLCLGGKRVNLAL
jgi:hypothetical protein